MTPQEPQPLVLYHAACLDGIASAVCAHRALQGNAEFQSIFYDQAPPDVTDRKVFILDFSFEPAPLQAMLDSAASVTLLDHHESALKTIGSHKFCCEGKPTLFHIEMGKCGARLTWEYFFPGQPIPDLLKVVESHDLWTAERTRYLDTLVYLESLPKDLATWLALLDLSEAELLERGQKASGTKAAIEALCRELGRQAHPVTLGGIEGLAVNAPHELRNELGNLLATRSGTFGLTWHITADLKVKVSFRGSADFDVLPLASRFGGKGHPKAAGLYLELAQLQDLLTGALAPLP